MLSRVADSLYWMSRYLERAENTARQLDVAMSLMLDPGASAEIRWRRLVTSLGNPPGLEWNGDLDSMAAFVIFNRVNRASVSYCLNQARENARQVREEISTEQWQRLNRLFHQIQSPLAPQQFEANTGDFFASIIDGIHLFKGVTDTTMSHDLGWQFIRLGRHLERAYATATLLEAFQPELHVNERETSGYRFLEQVGLLRCCTAFEAYCKVYTADNISPDRILEFLILNRHFPHAIRYSVDSAMQALLAIQSTGNRRTPDELMACVGRLSAMLGYTTVQEIVANDSAVFLHSIRRQSMLVHDLIYRYYVHYSIQSALSA
jgi:uncharacterized alpha-E superfamily protein